MNRLERLLDLVAVLIDTERPVTASALRREVPGYPPEPGPAFKRTFERDKATLRDMGIPLEAVLLEPSNPESETGYRVRRDRYELPDSGLAPEEVAALHLAATQVRLEGGDATAAIWKLGGVPLPGVGDGVGDRAAAALPGSDHLEALFGAAAERRAVTFCYRGATRKVDPWRLEFRNGAWYLIGFDHDRAERRTFRLDRIGGPVAHGPAGTFTAPAHPEPVSTRPWEMGDEDPVDVLVMVDADLATWAEATAGAPAERRADGSVVLSLRVTNRAGLRSWVLGLLDHAEVMGPPQEREAMVAWVAAAAGEDR